MNLDIDRATKPLRRLRRALRDFPAAPSPEQVHKLRTEARKIEALLQAVPGHFESTGERIFKLLKPLRKAAGRVRDMDVLMARAASVCAAQDCEGMVQLLEHIAKTRQRTSRKLARIIRKRGPEIRRTLKSAITALEQRPGSHDALAIESAAGPQIVAAELAQWPKLHRNNLHEFRIRVKNLRYMLQLFSPRDEHALKVYGEVQDAAGEWHDWLELEGMAQEILTAGQDDSVLRAIREQAREKLRRALARANSLRQHDVAVPAAA